METGTPASAFERVWQAYPERRRSNRPKVIAWFRKHQPDEALVAAILDGIERHKGDPARFPDWHRDGGRFGPSLLTWLREGRWEDEGLDPPTKPYRPKLAH